MYKINTKHLEFDQNTGKVTVFKITGYLYKDKNEVIWLERKNKGKLEVIKTCFDPKYWPNISIKNYLLKST